MQADIFLQKRNASHLERNALVGVFLRREFPHRPSSTRCEHGQADSMCFNASTELEYFSGVLLLTTNSIKRCGCRFMEKTRQGQAFTHRAEPSQL